MVLISMATIDQGVARPQQILPVQLNSDTIKKYSGAQQA